MTTNTERVDAAPSLSIVIPAFNEAHRLPATLDRLVEERSSIPASWVEIIVSSDGSTDATDAIVRARQSEGLRLVTRETNRGKGSALLGGYHAARGDLVLFLDADLPIPVAQIALFVEAANNADLVLGSRRVTGSSFDPPQPLHRRLVGEIFIVMARGLGFVVTSDPQCGCKLLRRHALEGVLGAMTATRFAFDVELITRAASENVPMVDVPVAWSHVEGSSLRPVRDGLRTVAEMWNVRRALRQP